MKTVCFNYNPLNPPPQPLASMYMLQELQICEEG